MRGCLAIFFSGFRFQEFCVWGFGLGSVVYGKIFDRNCWGVPENNLERRANFVLTALSDVSSLKLLVKSNLSAISQARVINPES